jgi:arabinose-5-phosphate isomerase
MSLEARASTGGLSHFEQLRYARQIIELESQTLAKVARRLGPEFCRAADCIFHCRGSVIVSGIGKAGLVGQKIMATLASTGSRSHCLHPAEAVHGDLGRVNSEDVMLVLSQSGETEEVLRMLSSIQEMKVPIIAITGRADSSLGKAAEVVIELGPVQEACPLGLAPSTSTTAMLAVGDALALVVSQMRGFGAEDFARFHPAGSLGRKLSKVQNHVRPLDQCRIASDRKTVREVIVAASLPGRRTGAIMLLDDEGRLSGIFTDSDLARLFERRGDRQLDEPIRNLMTAHPCTVPLGSMMSDAVAIMAERKISELPVVDGQGVPVGLIDITDLMARIPGDAMLNHPVQSTPSAHPSAGGPAGLPLRVFDEPAADAKS